VKAALYIVPTPIGNLDDITIRAIDVLRSVDIIAAEDTRHSKPLLRHYDVATTVVSFHEHSGEAETGALAERIAQGQSIALISDAGTPLVSDPGYQLVRAVQGLALPIIPLPGPCAAITALSAAGLPTHSFRFEGFLSAKRGARRARLEALRGLDSTVILYEAPHRILDLLDDLFDVFGGSREACVARELTKTFETVRRDTIAALREFTRSDSNQQRGEFVVMVAPTAKDVGVVSEEVVQLLLRLARELPPRKAAQVVAEHFGLKSRDLYQILIERG
jgi:16S rRNA (cytidine1402-2'-O)-methyltransferase